MRNTSVKTVAAALTAAAVLTLAACGADSGSGSGNGSGNAVVSVSGTPKAATVLDNPFGKPDMILTDTHGKKYDLVKETAGKPTLVYFGYTHCPDVCPTTMSDIAIAKSKLPKAERDKLVVVFITTDPARDTPKRLAAWLASMDPSFVGLTGDFTTIQAGARSVGIDVEKPVKEKDGSVTSTHGAQVLAYSPKDDKAHAIYMSGTTADQYAADLPKIIKGQTP
jgi:protein SCO1/2